MRWQKRQGKRDKACPYFTVSCFRYFLSVLIPCKHTTAKLFFCLNYPVWHAKDTSKKIRTVMRTKGMSGERISPHAPYGYLKGEDNKLVRDEETAPVVELIFQLAVEGNGPSKIARILQELEIVTPGTLAFQRTGRTDRYDPNHPYFWNKKTIANILERPEYLGQTVNFKTEKKSYKNKRVIKNPVDKQMIFENTHEALVTQEVWDVVQKNRQQRRRPNKQDEMGLFSGILYCADCGNKLYLSRCISAGKEQDYYTCSTYKAGKGECTAHYIREIILQTLVLENLRKVIAYARNNENEFVARVMQNQQTAKLAEQVGAKRQLEQQSRRIEEIDTIIKRLYEDNISGKLSDRRFAIMSTDYEQEQQTLEISTAELKKSVEEMERQTANVKNFLKVVKHYTEPEILTPDILHEFVEKIVVHSPDKSSGHRTQQVDIHYNFVGEVDLFGRTVKRETA